MQYSTIEGVVEEKFYSIYNEAADKAERDFKENYLKEIEGKHLLEQYKFLSEKYNWLDEKVDDLNPFYTEGYDNTDALLKTFASRSFILRIDESEILWDSIYFSIIKSKVVDLLSEAKKKIPPYTYQDFLNGKHDPYFLELDYLYHISKEDYYAIKIWQVDKFIDVVSYESQILITLLQKELESELRPQDYLNKLKQFYESRIEGQLFEDAEDLVSQLKKLPFMKGCDFSKLNQPSALANFIKFSENIIYWGQITPPNIKQIKAIMEQNPTAAFTPAYTLFYSINKVMLWVDDALDSGNFFQPIEAPNLEDIFTSTCQNAEQLAEKKIRTLSKGFSRLSVNDKKQRLYDILEGLRHELNEEGLFQDYYQVIYNESVVKYFLFTNAFMSNQPDRHIEHFTKAWVINECLEHFWSEWGDLTGKVQISMIGKASFDFMEAMQMVRAMPFDVDLYRRISNMFEKVANSLESHRTPIDFIQRNLEEAMRDLFFDCIENLSAHLAKSPIPHKDAYISSKLNDLRIRQIELKRYEGRINRKSEDTYTKIFQDCLEAQKQYINDFRNIDFTPILNSMSRAQAKQLPEKREFTFGLKPTANSLLNLIKALTVHVNFLNTDLTSPQDLYDVLSAENTLELDIKIHFGCYTNRVAYIIDKLKPYFKNLNPTSIGHSGLFFTNGGNELSRSNLYSNKVSNPSGKAKIDNIFKEF
ncbi:hypothetical protein J1N10_04575 [Carboxylicivirga sp. A043]|uniref:DUF6617 family protein n=1 Tax=Carboxylicivirga litoralis TaxID=2816963 RepID=UPI0021CB240F|nr:DUF6617 family protein [Carboxylicivirga sp. A043]MCU4155237.1 hypothetical protein [Carboxylicivirga sp. A043]